MAELQEPEPLEREVQRAFEEVRTARGLRPLTDEESGSGVDRLPNGVYGFTYSPALENFPLFRDRDLRSYEGHKLDDGSVLVLGFLIPEEKKVFETATENATIHLFPEPKDAATELVTVPTSRVVSHVEYSQRTGNGLELTIAAVRS